MKFAFYGMCLRIFEIIIFSALNQLEILEKQPNVDLKISVIPTDSKNIPKSKECNKGFCLYRWLHPVFRHPWERQRDSLASKELSKTRGFHLNIFKSNQEETNKNVALEDLDEPKTKQGSSDENGSWKKNFTHKPLKVFPYGGSVLHPIKFPVQCHQF